MSTKEILGRLRRKHIVVTGNPYSDMEFDKDGLRTLCPLSRMVSIQGMDSTFKYDRHWQHITDILYIDHSLRTVGNCIPATVTGHAKDLLDNATPDGKILNGLDFPMWKNAQWDRSAYATDMVAWDYLHGNQYCGTASEPYPTGHVRWGLAGTAHATSMFHIDSDGFATFVEVKCGKKLWAVYRPSPTLPLSDINVFSLSEYFQLDGIPEKAPFGLEAVILRPGDLLFVFFISFNCTFLFLCRLMQPGVPHFVYGLENAIIHGGHFYSSSLMQATLPSLIHTLVLSTFISNTFHHPSRQLLRRIAIFWGLGLLEGRMTPAGN